MIILVATDWHLYTHSLVAAEAECDFQVWPYSKVLRRRKLPKATYIFTDFDRLDFNELGLAGRLFQVLRTANIRVLNDPARVRQRYDLLRTLHAKSQNRFNVWRVEDSLRENRYPVFLRNESGHSGTLSGLLANETEVDQAIEDALQKGVPRRGMILVEYCAEPVQPDLFRKLAMYRVGDRLVPEVSVFQSNWHAKNGEKGIARQADYDEDLEVVKTKRYSDELSSVFHQADIEYGRADFGLVNGAVQTYEINTNPTIARQSKQHPFSARIQASQEVWRQYNEALQQIDTVETGHVRIRDHFLDLYRKRNPWKFFGRGWPM